MFNTAPVSKSPSTREEWLELAGMPLPDAIALAANPSPRAAGLLVGAECANGAVMQLAEGEELREIDLARGIGAISIGDIDYLNAVLAAIGFDDNDPEAFAGFCAGWNSVRAGK